jgi:hypothetical protein
MDAAVLSLKNKKEMINKYIKKIKDKSSWNKIRENWITEGSKLPPPHESKRLCILQMQRIYKINILIETGTYMGEMVKAMAPYFKKILTIELSKEIHQETSKKLSHLHNVSFLQGDSTDVLPDILKNITEPAIFWLDGHYSAGITARGKKDTPIIEELNSIKYSLYKDRHVILIDDARLFTENSEHNDYPTVREINEWVNLNIPNSSLINEHDIIMIIPKI